MAKRGGSELHHENWDQEDEPEEAGTFKKVRENCDELSLVRLS